VCGPCEAILTIKTPKKSCVSFHSQQTPTSSHGSFNSGFFANGGCALVIVFSHNRDPVSLRVKPRNVPIIRRCISSKRVFIILPLCEQFRSSDTVRRVKRKGIRGFRAASLNQRTEKTLELQHRRNPQSITHKPRSPSEGETDLTFSGARTLSPHLRVVLAHRTVQCLTSQFGPRDAPSSDQRGHGDKAVHVIHLAIIEAERLFISVGLQVVRLNRNVGTLQ
jgi:hypothetical protein